MFFLDLDFLNLGQVIDISFSSVQSSRPVMSDSLRPHEPQPARPPCPSQTPWVYSNSCTSSQWCHPAISSSVVPFSFCSQSLPASGSFPMSQLFACLISLAVSYFLMGKKKNLMLHLADKHKRKKRNTFRVSWLDNLFITERYCWVFVFSHSVWQKRSPKVNVELFKTCSLTRGPQSCL